MQTPQRLSPGAAKEKGRPQQAQSGAVMKVRSAQQAGQSVPASATATPHLAQRKGSTRSTSVPSVRRAAADAARPQETTRASVWSSMAAEFSAKHGPGQATG